MRSPSATARSWRRGRRSRSSSRRWRCQGRTSDRPAPRGPVEPPHLSSLSRAIDSARESARRGKHLSGQPVAVDQWSYYVLRILNPDINTLPSRLQVLGEDGWDLVTSVSTDKQI